MTKKAIAKGALMALATVGWGLVFRDAVPQLWQTDGITASCVALSIIGTVLRGWTYTFGLKGETP